MNGYNEWRLIFSVNFGGQYKKCRIDKIINDMKANFVKLLVLVSFVGFLFGCENQDDIFENEISGNTVNSSMIKKEKVVVNYDIDAVVNDINGKPHRFKGTLTVTYEDGLPVDVKFTGYYDGKFCDGLTIIVYTKEGKTYFDLTSGNEVNTFVNLLDFANIERL